MGADIHASIEYSNFLDETTGEPKIIMTFADVDLSRNYDMFAALGYRGRSDLESAVPLRGWPRKADGHYYGDIGWGFRKMAAMLVVRDGKAGQDGFDERGFKEEGDGSVITVEVAERYTHQSWSIWLPRDERDEQPDAEYRYISDPDIHTVNWITADEFALAIRTVERKWRSEVHAVVRLHDYRAALAAMKELEKDPQKKMLRLVYGFDN